MWKRCGKSYIVVWNRVRVLRTVWHTPTQNSTRVWGHSQGTTLHWEGLGGTLQGTTLPWEGWRDSSGDNTTLRGVGGLFRGQPYPERDGGTLQGTTLPWEGWGESSGDNPTLRGVGGTLQGTTLPWEGFSRRKHYPLMLAWLVEPPQFEGLAPPQENSLLLY